MIFAAECFAGRTIAVTGASSGLGRATAILLSRHGASIALIGRSEERLAETQAELAEGRHSSHVADLSHADGASDTIADIAKARGPLHSVFHAAGSTFVMPVKMIKDRHLDMVLGANLRGAFGVARAAAKRDVLTDGGSLVFMSSAASTRGRPALSAYCAAKAAIDGMVRSLALEFAPRRIRVNAIAAGAVATPMHDEFVRSISDEAASGYEALHPLGFGRPDDVANAAVFLMSDGARWITGTSLAVDGGAAI